MSDKNFRVVLRVWRRPWPFSWGPFGRREKVVDVVFSEGVMGIYQREKGKELVDPVDVVLHEGIEQLTTTIGFKGSMALRRVSDLRGDQQS